MKLLPLLFLVGLIGASAPAVPVPLTLTEATHSLRYAKAVESEPGRLEAIMAETYEAAGDTPVFGGPKGREASALLMYAILYNESGLRPHIERCDCTHGDGNCDHGHAYGLPQIHAEHLAGHSREEVCADRALQIQLAMRWLAKIRKVCGGGPEILTGCYNTGQCMTSASGNNSEAVFQRLLRRAHLRVELVNNEWTATSDGAS